jgi:uncharacterized membrane protein YGL010W
MHEAYMAELRLYRAHHQNVYNWGLHCIAVPLEWFTYCLLMSLASRALGGKNLYYALLGAIALYNALLDFPFGWIAAVALLCLSGGAMHIAAHRRPLELVLGSVLVHATSWLLQVGVGHWLLERNSPSMATKLSANSVLLSLLLAWRP